MGQQNARYPARKKVARLLQSINGGGHKKALDELYDAMLKDGMKTAMEMWTESQIYGSSQRVVLPSGTAIQSLQPTGYEKFRDKLNQEIGKLAIQTAELPQISFMPNTVRLDGTEPDADHYVAGDPITFKYTFNPPLDVREDKC